MEEAHIRDEEKKTKHIDPKVVCTNVSVPFIAFWDISLCFISLLLSANAFGPLSLVSIFFPFTLIMYPHAELKVKHQLLAECKLQIIIRMSEWFCLQYECMSHLI